MKSNLLIHLGFFYLLVNFIACITEYNAKEVDSIADLLVVEGTITEGETIIKLSRSINLDKNFTDATLIDKALVYVECSDGSRSEAGANKERGMYFIICESFKPDCQYRLHIVLDKEEYCSEFLSPVYTPEIDSIFSMKEGRGKPVYICVSTHDSDNQHKYYRWSYKENWEVHADLFANAIQYEVDGVIVKELIDMNSSDNRFFCWGTDSSKTLHLATTERLSENIILQKRLIELNPYSEKLSNLYRVEVEQMQIRKEAYDYFYNLQKNAEQSGGIFSIMPSEIKGNIKCMDDPDKIVIGYIEVSTIQTAEKYFPYSDNLYEPPHETCTGTIFTEKEYWSKDPGARYEYAIYVYYPFDQEQNLYAAVTCVDCRKKSRATKNKPWFWPNDHI